MTYDALSGTVKIWCDSRTVSGTYNLYLHISALTESGRDSTMWGTGWSITVSPSISGVAFASLETTINLAPATEGTYNTPALSLVPTDAVKNFIW